MITRTLIQKKVFDICCQSTILSGHGYFDCLKGIDFIKGQEWESDNKCNELLKHCTEKWEKLRKEAPHTTTQYAPKLSIYWETIKINY